MSGSSRGAPIEPLESILSPRVWTLTANLGSTYSCRHLASRRCSFVCLDGFANVCLLFFIAHSCIRPPLQEGDRTGRREDTSAYRNKQQVKEYALYLVAVSSYLVAVLFRIFSDQRVPLKSPTNRIEGNGDVVLLEDLHDAPDGSSGPIVELRFGCRIT